MLINQLTLINFLSTVRPANSAGEHSHTENIIQLCLTLGYQPTTDGYGNVIVDNLKDTDSRVMFTSHTDSIHRGKNLPSTQAIKIVDGMVKLDYAKSPTSTCLGADDATGNYVMLRLLQANVPGIYCFFRDEEVGGLGSQYFRDSKANAELLESLTHCISFDRKGYDSIITSQYKGTCASDEFAYALADIIYDADASKTLKFEPDPTGSFTDSANFDDVIAECTNLSVGYFDQHMVKESQDIEFVEKLCLALTAMDWTTLPVYRDPTKRDDVWGYSKGGYDAYSTYDDFDNRALREHDDVLYELYIGGYDYALELVLNQPELAAELLDKLNR